MTTNSSNPKRARRIAACTAAALVCALALPLAMGQDATASAPAATRAATTGPADPEFCSAFLNQQLQQDLGLSDDQVKKMGDLKLRLQMMIDNVMGRMPSAQVSALALTRISDTALTRCGADAKAILTPAQVDKFNALFKDGTLKPLQVRTAAARTGRNPSRGTTFGRVEIVCNYKNNAAPSDASAGSRVQTPAGEATAHVANATPVGPTARATTPPARRGRAPDAAATVTVTTLQDAERLLAGAPAEQAAAARWLVATPVDPKEQAKVLDLLKPLLEPLKTAGDARDQVVFVEAFARWADASSVDHLVMVLESHKDGLPNNFDKCWSAAIVPLAHLDVKAAEKVLTARKGQLFFKNAVVNALKPLAQGEGPDKPLAEHLLVILLL
jgi:hypothetical protein